MAVGDDGVIRGRLQRDRQVIAWEVDATVRHKAKAISFRVKEGLASKGDVLRLLTPDRVIAFTVSGELPPARGYAAGTVEFDGRITGDEAIDPTPDPESAPPGSA